MLGSGEVKIALRLGSRGWVRAVPFFVVSFAGTLAFRTLVPVVAFLVSEELKAGVAGAAIASASFIAARGLASILSGWLFDRFKGARWLPMVSFSLFPAVALLFALAHTAWDVALLKAAQGALSGLSWPLVQTALALSVSESIRGRALSVYFGLGSLAGLLANLVYAAIAQWPLLAQLLLSALLYVLAATAYALSKPSPRRIVRRSTGAAPQLAVVMAAFAVSALCSFSFGEVSYALLSSMLAIGRPETAIFVAIVTAAGLLVSYALSWVADLGYETQALYVTLAAAVSAPLILPLGGLLSLASYVLAIASQMTFKPLARRYLATKSGSPGLAIGAVNAASNIGTCVGQVVVALVLA